MNALEVLRFALPRPRLKSNIRASKSPYTQLLDKQEPAPGTWVSFHALVIDIRYYLYHVDHIQRYQESKYAMQPYLTNTCHLSGVPGLRAPNFGFENLQTPQNLTPPRRDRWD
jgi:hypothetical protein